jgi:hypothetical protein
MSLGALSTELQQGILGYLDFISLLNIKYTSTIWRDRVNTALSKTNIILPARAKLLELYLELPRHPSCRPPDDIEPFLGEEYLSKLRAEIAQQAPNANVGIPAEFELWILEWPHIAELGFTWFAENYGYGEDDGGIGCSNPKRMLVALSSTDEYASEVGIFVRGHGCQDYSILFFEEGKESGGVVWKGDICQLLEEAHEEEEDEEEDDDEEEEEDDEEEVDVEKVDVDEVSWVDWLRIELNGTNNIRWW